MPRETKSLALIALSSCLLWGGQFAFNPSVMAADDAYPHITTLEKAILGGTTYTGESLTSRLSRMEAKAFGKASSDPDLSQRTDDLEDYSQKTLHQRPFGAGSAWDVEQQEKAGTLPVQYEDQQDGTDSASAGGGSAGGGSAGGGSAGGASAPATEYPHITALEKSILEQTYPGQPLADRLARMETKAFGSPSPNGALSDRTDALEEYAQKKLHKVAFAKEQQKEAEANGGVAVDGSGGSSSGGSSGGGHPKLMNFVGNSLLGMAGSALMPGFGGVRMRPRSSMGNQAQQQEAPVEPRPDDPAVNAAVPPPAGAKMLTQVGWCEVQLFGHTFSAHHLTNRLAQLNKELNYDPNKTPLALMDDMPGIIKSVQARKLSQSKPAPQPAVQ